MSCTTNSDDEDSGPNPATSLVDRKLPKTVTQARTVYLTIVRLELSNGKNLAVPLGCRLSSAKFHRSDALEATLRATATGKLYSALS
jgi:hypothetical protein